MEKMKLRPASGDEQVLMNAREAIASARTVEQLRQAQAVVLPLDGADRLDIGRVGKTPNPERLFAVATKVIA